MQTRFPRRVQIPELHNITWIHSQYLDSLAVNHIAKLTTNICICKRYGIEELEAVGSLPGQEALAVSLKFCHVRTEFEEFLPDKIHPYITLKGQCSNMHHTITFTLQ